MSNELMSEEGLKAYLACAADCLARTALHHLARAKAAEAELTDLRAGLRAAHAERDAVTVERDEAYRQRDEAKRLAEVAAIGERMQGRVVREVRAALGAFDIETTEGAAERVMAQTSHATIILRNALVDGADTIEDLASIARAQFFDLRTILGATDNETLSDAARRVKDLALRARADLIPSKDALKSIRGTLETPEGKAVTVHAVDLMAELRLLRDAAEAEPAQTFHPSISVTLVSGPDLDHPCAQLKVGLIGDPAFLALSGNDYARLALVVTRG